MADSTTQSTETVNAPADVSTGQNAPTPQNLPPNQGPPDQSHSAPETASNTPTAGPGASQPAAANLSIEANGQNAANGNDTPQDAPATSPSVPKIDSTLPEMDSTIEALDTSQSFMDAGLTSFDSALPSVSSSAAPDLSLPAIDTTMPSFDSTLPAIGTDIPTMDDDHDFGDSGHFDTSDSHAGSVEPGNNGTPINGTTHYNASSNGGFQYAQQPEGHQPPTQAQSQHQFQANPQPQPPQNYQPHSQDLYHNPGFSTVNTNHASNGQGQPGQIPQAPIGSPMPPMSSMSQYMTGYPSQSGIDANGMRYPLSGDPNKMLSSARHKKEVKRRTKTGCLTCRKRRIKVRLDILWLILWMRLRGADLACARRPRHRLFRSRLNPPRPAFRDF